MPFSFSALSWIALGLALFDFLTVTLTRFIKPISVSRRSGIDDDFTILIPIFGDLRYLKNVEFLASYGHRVVLCTTNRESSSFNREINAIAKRYGFTVFRSPVSQSLRQHSPNPWRLFHRTLHGIVEEEVISETARDEIIRESFSAVSTQWCIFLDGDTVADDQLGRLVRICSRKKFDLASVRILPSRTTTLVEKMQTLEYTLAMDARRLYPWLTSGAAMIARTTVIKDIMQHHSLFFSGGDIEIGKLAKSLGYRVGHIPFVFYTDVPPSFRTWFRQRRAWFGGGFRHAIINIHFFSWSQPLFFIYTTIIVYGSMPVRWYEAIQHPEVIPIIIAIYWILVSVFQFKSWKPWYLLYPFYSLFQVMIVIVFGVIEYFRMVFRSKNPGIIRHRFS